MAEFFIQKVRKDDNKVIIGVRTLKNQFSTLEVVKSINDGNIFFVLNKVDGMRVAVYKERFIRSYKDGKWNNNLDELPEF